MMSGQRSNLSTRQMTAVALMVALTSVSAYIILPIGPVPVTMQSSVVLTAGAILGGRLGAISQIVYLIMGIIGIPVFAGGRSGPGIILTPTFGYLIGFIAAAYLTGILCEKRKHPAVPYICWTMVLGTMTLMFCGVVYLYLNFNYMLGQETAWSTVLSIGLIPFLPVEGLKIALATGVVYALNKQGLSFVDSGQSRV